MSSVFLCHAALHFCGRFISCVTKHNEAYSAHALPNVDLLQQMKESHSPIAAVSLLYLKRKGIHLKTLGSGKLIYLNRNEEDCD